MKTQQLKKIIRRINWYPPYIGAGISIIDYSEDCTRFVSQLGMTWFNRNIFGTHFGGSLYAMCDPFFVFILIANLGDGFIVWDKTATIHFRKPGKGKMTATFEIKPEKIAEIRAEMIDLEKNTYWFKTQVIDEKGVVIAEVEKEIYIRNKAFKKAV